MGIREHVYGWDGVKDSKQFPLLSVFVGWSATSEL